MKLTLDIEDLAMLLRQSPAGRDRLIVQGIEQDSILFQLAYPRLITFTLQKFELQEEELTAELYPWWVRGLVILFLKWWRNDWVRAEGSRILMRFPAQLRERIRIEELRIDGVVEVRFSLKEGVPVP